MCKQLASPRFRFTIRALMILVAVAAFALTWVYVDRSRRQPLFRDMSHTTVSQ